MIVVSGAAGKTGRAVIRTLAARGARVRAFVRRPEQADAASLGACEAVAGDMLDPARWADALRGARSLYLTCPNMAPDEEALAETAMEASVRAGVRHLVYHSVLHPQTEAMPHHWHKLRVEERLVASRLPYTILQPAAYMQNVLAGWEDIVGRGVYRVPYATDTRLGMVDLEDVAAVAALVLTEAGHEGAIYELAGAEVLTQTEVASSLSEALGRAVRAETIPLDSWEAQARSMGLDEYAIETLLAMFRYYEQHGFWGNPHVLSWLLGRPPTSFRDFLARSARTREREGHGPSARI
jgi:uncharacterized protein YbjT (DUF2867 family)